MSNSVDPAHSYVERVVDAELDLLLTGLPAISVEGAKAVAYRRPDGIAVVPAALLGP